MNLVSLLTTPSAKRTKLLLKAIDGSNRLQRELAAKADRKTRPSGRRTRAGRASKKNRSNRGG